MWRRNLYGAWLSQLLAIAGFGFVLPFVPFYIQELGVTNPDELRLWTGILSAAPALGMAIMAPIWGLLADRWGKKLMMLRAMFFGTIIMSLMAITQSVQAVLVLRICQGLFTGTMTAAAALVATGTPKHRLSYALGLLSSSTFIGISVGPMIGGLVAEWVGYRPSFLMGGAMVAIGFVLVLVLVHESDADASEDDESTIDEPELKRRPLGRLASVISMQMLGLFTLILILRFVRALPIPFLPLYVQELRGELAGSATATGMISAGRGAVTALSAVTITRLGDRHPRMLLVGILLAAAGVLSLPLYFAGSIWAFSAFLILATFFLGGVEPLIQADLSSRVSPARRGLLFGVQSSIASMGWFVAPLVGSLISIRLSIAHIFLILTVFLFITAAVVFVVYLRNVKDERKVRDSRQQPPPSNG
ncbi:MAG: MFS transporter [Spirochaetaceae bacterium]|nr:MFS transporter [Spirochaetaceae bacterium]